MKMIFRKSNFELWISIRKLLASKTNLGKPHSELSEINSVKSQFVYKHRMARILALSLAAPAVSYSSPKRPDSLMQRPVGKFISIGKPMQNFCLLVIVTCQAIRCRCLLAAIMRVLGNSEPEYGNVVNGMEIVQKRWAQKLIRSVFKARSSR